MFAILTHTFQVEGYTLLNVALHFFPGFSGGRADFPASAISFLIFSRSLLSARVWDPSPVLWALLNLDSSSAAF